MAKITVYVESDNPADLRAALQELLTGAPVVVGAPEPAKPAKPKKATESKPEPVVAADPALAADPVEPPAADPAPAPAPAPAAKEKKITHEDLREAMQPLKREVSLQLVAEFSGKAPEEKPKLSDVPAEKHAELLAEAQRLSQLPENVKQAIA